MAEKSKLSSPHIHVLMVDGSDWDVQSLNADMLRWERYAIKNHLPVNPGGAPVNWMTYLAWSAGQRESMVPATMAFPAFADACASVDALDEPAGAAVDPTAEGADID